ncbi:MAG: hypothetical protein H0U00_02055 [Actinobacteria bacterium]|nr:hypothetical protein [Actinomycetota bacterium]
MQAADQWKLIERDLGPDWDEAHFVFSIEDAGSIGDAAAVLAPLGPGRAGGELRFNVARRGGGPDKLRNLVARLDRKRIWGTLTLVESRSEPRETTSAAEPVEAVGLVESWDAALAELPPGWRDLLCELELDSTDYLPRAALLGAPLNPTRNPEEIALRFRVSSGVGYGTSPGMARRCLERIEGDGITGRTRVLNVLSDTGNEATLGPVWRIAGSSV